MLFILIKIGSQQQFLLYIGYAFYYAYQYAFNNITVFMCMYFSLSGCLSVCVLVISIGKTLIRQEG